MKVNIRVPIIDLDDEALKAGKIAENLIICNVSWDSLDGSFTGDKKGVEYLNYVVDKAVDDYQSDEDFWKNKIEKPIKKPEVLVEILRHEFINVPEELLEFDKDLWVWGGRVDPDVDRSSNFIFRPPLI